MTHTMSHVQELFSYSDKMADICRIVYIILSLKQPCRCKIQAEHQETLDVGGLTSDDE